VLAEDDDIQFVGPLHGRRHTVEVAYRPHADVEVQNLAQSHIETADTPAHRCGQRSFDGDVVLADDIECILGEPGAGLIEGLLPGQHFAPLDPALAAVSRSYG